MNGYIFLFFIIIVITILSSLCIITYLFLKKILKSTGKTRIKGAFKLFKIFEFNFEAEHENKNK